MATAPMSSSAALAALGIAPSTSAGTTAGTTPTTTAAAAPAASSAATAQAAAGAQETFNAKAFVVPKHASTKVVLHGLARAMQDPTINASSAQTVYGLYQQIAEAEKAMTQAILDLMAAT